MDTNTESAKKVKEFAETISSIHNVDCDLNRNIREAMSSYTVDFTIGNVDEYRVWAENQEYRAIQSGSVKIGADSDAGVMHPKYAKPEYLEVEELSVHLPPYQKGADEWKNFISDSYDVSFREKSGGLMSVMPYPNPHIESTDTCSLGEATEIIRDAARAYEMTQQQLLANREDTKTGLDAGRAKRE